MKTITFLGFDVGNSKVKAGIFRGCELVESSAFDTAEMVSGYPDFRDFFKDIKPARIGIASVVPSVNEAISEKCLSLFNVIPEIVKWDSAGLPMGVESPESTGIDRVMNCTAAVAFYGYPVIVADMGTAITVDVVSGEGVFVGGIIMPGPSLWAESLCRTELIRVEGIDISAPLVGRNTHQAVSSGILNGITGAVESVVDSLKKRFPGAGVVFTGGWSPVFSLRIDCRHHERQNLALEGLGIVLSGGLPRK